MTEARLSGFDQWAAWSAANTLTEKSKEAVLTSASFTQQRTKASDDPAWSASLGVRHLLLGEWPQAIPLLEISRAMPGDRASRLNDLAAACFAQASATKNAERLAYALDLAEAAARESPALLAARFNRALILESLGPASRAAEAWSDYLSVDAASGWGREAAGHRDRLLAAVQQMRPDPAREDATSRSTVEDQLHKWAEAIATHDRSGAEAAIKAAEAAAADVRARTTNAYPAGLVTDARRHEQMGRGRSFALAYLAGTEGDRLLVQNDIQKASLRITEGGKLISPGGTFADYLEYLRLRAAWYQQKVAGPLEQPVGLLIARAQRNGMGYIAARSEALLGSILQTVARYSDAIDSYQRSIDGYQRIGELTTAEATRMLLAAALREHGLWHDAWQHEAMALAAYDALTNDSQRHSVLHEATRLALWRKQTDLAARFQGFLAAHAAEWKDPSPSGKFGALVSASVAAARIAMQRGLPQQASAHLAKAEEAFALIPDKNFRDSYNLELLTLKTEVQTLVAPALAVESARTLLESSKNKQVLFRRVRAFQLLGRAAMAAGQPEVAAAAWQSGIAALEVDNRAALEDRMRIARTSDVWSIYDDLIRLRVDQKQPEEALAVAERGRARALLSALAPSPPRIAINARMGANATILFYALLPKRTLIWVIDGRAITLRDEPGGAELVTALSSELRAAATSQRQPGAVLKRLHAALISPVASSLPPERPLIVVPDGLLSSVPFAALQSPDTSRLLVEDHELQVAPSLTLLQRALDKSPIVSSAPRVFALASPAASGNLPALPGARNEVKQINEVYDRPPQVIDSMSVQAFLDNVRRSDVVHFAGHAVEDRDFPDHSYLALPNSARLRPSEIRSSDFRGVRLLVLSACSTAEGAVERGEGVLSLARPFLAADVSQVLATVTAVDDDVAPMLVDFHKNLRKGMKPATALRSAQLDAWKRDDRISLRGWAAFELFGVLPSR